MDHDSFDQLFRPEVLIGVSSQRDAASANACVDVQPDNRTVRSFTSSRSCGRADGGSQRRGFLRLFSRLVCAGQYAFYEKTNLFCRPVVNLVPIAVVAGRIIHFLRRCLPLRWLTIHVVNHMSGVAQIVGNISQARGNLTQVFGRTSHV